MDVRKDFLPRLKEQKQTDKTYSYSGKPDFTPTEEGDLKEVSFGGNPGRVRTKQSQNNSYT